VRSKVADEIEAFIEIGALWDPPGCAAIVGWLRKQSEETDDPIPTGIGRFIESVRLRQEIGTVSPAMRAEIEAIVYPRLWKMIEAIRAEMPIGEQRTRLEVMNRRLARLFVEETVAPSVPG
jgi:hypothetical protein